MPAAALPLDEPQRLAVLHALGVLDGPPEPVLDGLVRCAATMAATPMAVLSLVDAQRQWFIAQLGLEVQETDRAVSFCAHAIHDDALLAVENAALDPRFMDNPLVNSGLNVRFYAGVPIKARGRRLGTLCVFDTVPRVLPPTEQLLLSDLARAASHWFEARADSMTLASSHTGPSLPPRAHGGLPQDISLDYPEPHRLHLDLRKP